MIYTKTLWWGRYIRGERKNHRSLALSTPLQLRDCLTVFLLCCIAIRLRSTLNWDHPELEKSYRCLETVSYCEARRTIGFLVSELSLCHLRHLPLSTDEDIFSEKSPYSLLQTSITKSKTINYDGTEYWFFWYFIPKPLVIVILLDQWSSR